MNFKLVLVSLAASAMAANSTAAGNTTSTATSTAAETSNGAGHIANAGLFGAVIAGGVALML